MSIGKCTLIATLWRLHKIFTQVCFPWGSAAHQNIEIILTEKIVILIWDATPAPPHTTHVSHDLRFLCSHFTSLKSRYLTLTQPKLLEIWPLGDQMTSVHINSNSTESIYGQEGWWVGNPCEGASGMKYQSCYLCGETASSGNSMMSEAFRALSLIRDWCRHIKDGDWGQWWWKLMDMDIDGYACALATTRRPTIPAHWVWASPR